MTNMNPAESIARDLEDILKSIGISDIDRKKAFTELNQAVLLNFGKNVMAKLPEEYRSTPVDASAIEKYAKEHLSQDEAQECLKDATYKVFSELADDMQRKAAP